MYVPKNIYIYNYIYISVCDHEKVFLDIMCDLFLIISRFPTCLIIHFGNAMN